MLKKKDMTYGPLHHTEKEAEQARAELIAMREEKGEPYDFDIEQVDNSPSIWDEIEDGMLAGDDIDEPIGNNALLKCYLIKSAAGNTCVFSVYNRIYKAVYEWYILDSVVGDGCKIEGETGDKIYLKEEDIRKNKWSGKLLYCKYTDEIGNEYRTNCIQLHNENDKGTIYLKFDEIIEI